MRITMITGLPITTKYPSSARAWAVATPRPDVAYRNHRNMSISKQQGNGFQSTPPKEDKRKVISIFDFQSPNWLTPVMTQTGLEGTVEGEHLR